MLQTKGSALRSNLTCSTVTSAVYAAVLICSFLLLVPPAAAQQGVLQDGAILDSIETPYGTIHKVHRARSYKGGGSGLPSFNGDTFSFKHALGAIIDGVAKCLDDHHAKMLDNTVTFDGLSEPLDPFLDGTEPFVFEFETSTDGMSTTSFFNSFADGDLFPEGFTDPDTGGPLDVACLEIGIDDSLDSTPSSVSVESAMIEASDSKGTPILPPTDIKSFFSDPFDGRLNLVFEDVVGEGVDGLILEMQMQFDPQPIFADGFESGDASAWTDSAP